MESIPPLTRKSENGCQTVMNPGKARGSRVV
jgi:hypothetical protein